MSSCLSICVLCLSVCVRISLYAREIVNTFEQPLVIGFLFLLLILLAFCFSCVLFLYVYFNSLIVVLSYGRAVNLFRRGMVGSSGNIAAAASASEGDQLVVFLL